MTTILLTPYPGAEVLRTVTPGNGAPAYHIVSYNGQEFPAPVSGCTTAEVTPEQAEHARCIWQDHVDGANPYPTDGAAMNAIRAVCGLPPRGTPPSPTPRDRRVMVNFTADELAALDAARGTTPRSEYVRAAVLGDGS